MKTLDEYIDQRKARSPEFAATREASQPRFELRRTLIQARLAAGLSQKELADRSGLSHSTIGRIESDRDWPRVNSLFKIAHALDVTFIITPQQTMTFRSTEISC